MFQKIVVVDNTGMNEWAKNRLRELSKEVVFYDDFPTDVEEIIERAKSADCLMVSYCTLITKEIIEKCPNLKYIGMCCTLYNEKSANVDVVYAKERGIIVRGINNYGDGGVIEFIISALADLLHGFNKHQWKKQPNEFYNQKIGIIGLGNTGFKLARILKFMDANVSYSDLKYCEEAEKLGICRRSLEELLKESDIICTLLPKNTFLLKKKEFELFGNGKIIVNTSIGPTFDIEAMKQWLDCKDNYYICDGVGIGNTWEQLHGYTNMIYTERCAGSSEQCTLRLSQKSIENIEHFLYKNKI